MGEGAHGEARAAAVLQSGWTWTRAEERYQLETRVEADAESLYERRWAFDLLDRVLDRLRHEAVASGKAPFSMDSKAVCWASG